VHSFNGLLGSSKDLFDVDVSTETAHDLAGVVSDYTREYTSVGYIISVRTRLFSPSSPGESFLCASSNHLKGLTARLPCALAAKNRGQRSPGGPVALRCASEKK
jgi:hypothetical protein